MATPKTITTRNTSKAKATANKKETTNKKENTTMNNYTFQATPILIFYAKKSATTNDPIPHAKYYTNEDHDTFYTINDRTTDKPYTTLDTQIIFQTEDNQYYIIKAQLPKIDTITDSTGRTYTSTKNYLRDYVIKPMLSQQGGLNADENNFTIINTAIDLKLQFTLEQTYYTTKDNQTKEDYHIVNTKHITNK